MKKLLLALIFIIVASCGGTETVEEATERFAKTMCKKIFTCEETKAYEAFFGGTEAGCITMIKTNEDKEDDDCKSINQSKVDECIKCYENLSCADFAESMQSEDDETCSVCDETCND